MADTVIGKVSLTPKGEYNPTTQYEALDVVQYQGSGYIVCKPCTGVTPEDGEHYMLAAERGSPGETGPKGPAGPAGPQGEPGADGVTMEQVNAAIDAAITGAIEEAY